MNRIYTIFFLLLFIGMPIHLSLASSPETIDDFSASIALSEGTIQQFLEARFMGQNVSQSPGQEYGFEHLVLNLNEGSASLSGQFWYKKFLSPQKKKLLFQISGEGQVSFALAYSPQDHRLMLKQPKIEKFDLKEGKEMGPFLRPMIETVLQKVAIWKNEGMLRLGSLAVLPISDIQTQIQKGRVVVHLNQENQFPKKMSKEMIALSSKKNLVSDQWTSPEALGGVLEQLGKELPILRSFQNKHAIRISDIWSEGDQVAVSASVVEKK